MAGKYGSTRSAPEAYPTLQQLLMRVAVVAGATASVAALALVVFTGQQLRVLGIAAVGFGLMPLFSLVLAVYLVMNAAQFIRYPNESFNRENALGGVLIAVSWVVGMLVGVSAAREHGEWF